jgi:hypothetical protein
MAQSYTGLATLEAVMYFCFLFFFTTFYLTTVKYTYFAPCDVTFILLLMHIPASLCSAGALIDQTVRVRAVRPRGIIRKSITFMKRRLIASRKISWTPYGPPHSNMDGAPRNIAWEARCICIA